MIASSRLFAQLSLDEDENDPALAAVLAIVWSGAEITGGLDLILGIVWGETKVGRKTYCILMTSVSQ